MSYPLGALLGRAQQLFIADCEARLAAAGYPDLAIAHGTNVLRHLTPGESLRVPDLVRASGISKQAVSQQLAYLSKHDYVSVGPDPSDRRAKIVELTDHGAKALTRIQRVFAEVHRDWGQEYGVEEFRGLMDILTRITGLGATEPTARQSAH
jgi:DNA-binding MarR family transcriptional regulator